MQDCIDGLSLITGTSAAAFDDLLLSLIPPLRHQETEPANIWDPPSPQPVLDPAEVPATPVVLDVVDFVMQHVAEPVSRTPHDWGKHEHLGFGEASGPSGRRQFADEVELIFQRNGIGFSIGPDMKVARLGPPEARPLLSDFDPRTGDSELDFKLRDAANRFLSRDPQHRVDALEKLWDAFERMKTLELRGDKRNSILLLIDRAVPNSGLADYVDSECSALTRIGNQFQIRHFEHDKEPLPGTDAVDYLFTRLASLIAFFATRDRPTVTRLPS